MSANNSKARVKIEEIPYKNFTHYETGVSVIGMHYNDYAKSVHQACLKKTAQNLKIAYQRSLNMLCKSCVYCTKMPGIYLYPDGRCNMCHAFEEAKIKIDEFGSTEKQVESILKLLRPILPIKFEVRKIQVRIPAVYAAKSYQTIRSLGKLLKEEWQNDGSLLIVTEMPAGMQEEFFNQLNALTKGEVETKIIEGE